jgi:hypothetical protein
VHLVQVVGAAGDLEQSQEAVEVDGVRICMRQPQGRVMSAKTDGIWGS